MKIKQHGAALGLLVAGALLLSACGSDANKAPGGQSGSAGAASVECGGKKDVKGDGSSAQGNAMSEFTADYAEACKGYQVAYAVSSSGDGIKNFLAKSVDFAGSDSPLTADQVTKGTERCGGTPLHLPLVFGPVAIAYNLPNVEGVVLTPELIAKVFSGAITTWSDPAIKALNSGLNLPEKKITPIYRSGTSGTTENFQQYLTSAAPTAWTKGGGKEFKGGVGEGKQKSADVANATKATEGAITYVESSFADGSKLSKVKIDSGAGPVELTTDTASKAIAGAKISGTGNDLVIDLKALYASKEAGAYPLVLVTYEIVCSKGYDADTTKAVKSFLNLAATRGQERLPKVGYVPLPKEIRTKLQDSIKTIA